ncbi:MAG: VanZ family protein [Chitinophagales bacterium]|nr:VanZ family protein [Chitinophagales bacterium]
MPVFVSKRERRLWIFLLLIMIAIYATLGVVVSLTSYLRDREVLTIGFFLCLGLIAVMVFIDGWRRNADKAEIIAWIGIFTVYLLMFLRMSIAEERGHLVEYSVVGVLVFSAIKERAKFNNIRHPYLIAMLITCLLGIFDEAIQYFIPIRVFDPLDMVFNTGAGVLAILSAMLISSIRKKTSKVK